MPSYQQATKVYTAVLTSPRSSCPPGLGTGEARRTFGVAPVSGTQTPECQPSVLSRLNFIVETSSVSATHGAEHRTPRRTPHARMDRSQPSPRRAVVTSRQKSCNLCVQTKSRCNRQIPVCARCAEKNVRCTWGKQAVTAATRQLAASRTETDLVFTSGSPPVDAAYLRNTDGGIMPQSLLLEDFISHDDLPLSGFMDFTGSGSRSIPSPSQWRFQTDGDAASHEFPTPPEEGQVDPLEYRKMASFCVSTATDPNISLLGQCSR